MLGGKGVLQHRQRRQLHRRPLHQGRQRHQQPLLGIRIPQLERDLSLQTTTATIPIGQQLLLGIGQCPLHLLRQRRHHRRLQWAAHGTLPPLALTRLAHAIGREDSSQGMEEHLIQAQRPGQTARQLPCSTAVGDQNTTTDVVAPRERHLLDCRCHGLHRQIQGALRQLLGRALQGPGEGRKLITHHL